MQAVQIYCGRRFGSDVKINVSAQKLSLDTAGLQQVLQKVKKTRAEYLLLCLIGEGSSPLPGKQTEFFVSKLEVACMHLEIQCLDVVVVTTNTYYSFREAGRLWQKIDDSATGMLAERE